MASDIIVNICIEDHLYQFAQALSVEAQIEVVKPEKIEKFELVLK